MKFHSSCWLSTQRNGHCYVFLNNPSITGALAEVLSIFKDTFLVISRMLKSKKETVARELKSHQGTHSTPPAFNNPCTRNGSTAEVLEVTGHL